MSDTLDIAETSAPSEDSPIGATESPDHAAEESSAAESNADLNPEAIIEAVLFSADVPIPGAKLAQILGVGDASDVRDHVESLNRKYVERSAAYRIEEIAKGYQLLTLPIYDRWVQKLHQARQETRLSGAALETLAIVAYKQPVLRADVEAIRGVAVGDMLNRLREMNLVRIVGRAEEIGRPLLYGTTSKFLEAFGLASLNDLPKVDADRPNEVPKLKIAEPQPAD